MRLHITKQDFDEGVECHSDRCPVAISANREAARLGWDRVHSWINFYLLYGGQGKTRVRTCSRKIFSQCETLHQGFRPGKTERLYPLSRSVSSSKDIPDLTAGNPGQERKQWQISKRRPSRFRRKQVTGGSDPGLRLGIRIRFATARRAGAVGVQHGALTPTKAMSPTAS